MTPTEHLILQNQAKIMLAIAMVLNGNRDEQANRMIKELMKDSDVVVEFLKADRRC